MLLRLKIRMGLYVQLALVLVLLGIAGAAGLWMGQNSVPEYASPLPKEMTADSKEQKQAAPNEIPAVKVEGPPVFFSAGALSENNWKVVLEEIAMSKAAGIHQYVIAVPFPWGGPKALEDIVARLGQVIAADPQATLFIRVTLNPPEAWIQAHPEECAIVHGDRRPYPSPASGAWLTDAGNVLAALVTGMEVAPFHERIQGYLLGALEQERWFTSGGFDESPASLRGFHDWLRLHYGKDSAVQAAWGNTAITIDTAAIPVKPDNGDLHNVFLSLPQSQPVVDFLRYTSEVTAKAIESFAALVDSVSEADAKVVIPYGFSYELSNNDSGHFALGTLLESSIDGFSSPISNVDRALGGTGGAAGPIDSAALHGKQWYILDDTRTGMVRDPATGSITRMKGLRADDIYNVQRRNFCLAAFHGAGLMWADPSGDGWLRDMEQWDRLGQMRDIYEHMLDDRKQEDIGEGTNEGEATASERTTEASEGEDDIMEEGGEGFELEGAGNLLPAPFTSSALTVVVDESSRFYQQCDVKLNELLLHQGREAALRAGLSTRFCLLQDVIQGLSEPTPLYLFLNAFHLTQEDRDRLHARLAREKAIALWLYAPGYIDQQAGEENIAATVKMKVASFSGGGDTGSSYSLEGRWLKQGEAFGGTFSMSPLFYIEDGEADTLAQYRASSKVSIAMRPQDGGWSSVYIAEPNLTPEVLREILRLFEQHLYIGPTEQKFTETLHARGNYVAIHARQAGERMITLGRFCNVEDLFDTSMGWPEKDSFYLPMKAGETRLIKLAPI